MECPAECLAECLVGTITRIFPTIFVVLIDQQIVQRRDEIVRNGRQLQKTLRLPDCMCVIAHAEPGLLHGDLRLAAQLLGFACLSGNLGMGLALYKGTFWDSWVFGFIFIGPACLLVLLFLSLFLAKRRLLRNGAGFEDARPSQPGERNIELERSVQCVWANAW